jgi:type I restriction enzyme M protein
MHEVQTFIDDISLTGLRRQTVDEIESWRRRKFKWAEEYVYGVEKDERLAKVTKVGCYLHGDGLAQVIHGDGLDNFSKSKHYTGILSRKGKDLSPDKRENPVFDFVISNPPYSVGAFKVMVQNAINAYGE